jgi:CubicO group peptidase (beta-lactamase class C family)
VNRFLVALLATVAACGTDVPVDERIANIESAVIPALVIRGESVPTSTLADRLEELNVPGVSIAVINNGEIEWARGYGFADKAREIPVTPETLFQAASISKPVAAMAALKFVEDGLLDLDRNVNEKLTSWQIPDNEFTTERKVTLRGLVNHSAGTTVWGFPGYERGGDIPATVGVLDGEGNTDPIRVWKEPGESWRYSGGGYTVMQLMLSDVAGKPFPQLMAETVLEPIGMSNSTYEQPLPESRHAQAATAYQGNGYPVEGDWHVYPEMAAAGLWTTPTDLAKYAMEVQRAYAGEGRILSQEMTRQMLQPGMNSHGLGPSISGDRFGHGGSNAGFRCQLTAFIEGGRGAVVMTNSDNGGRLAQELLITIFAEYGWEGIEPEEKVVVILEPTQYQALAGVYQLEGIEEPVEILSFGRRLTVSTVSGGRRLLAESETEFFLADDGTPVRFIVEDGTATGIVVGGSIRGEKIR